MAATFTVEMTNGLDEQITREELTVDVEMPAGWGLLHVAEDTAYPILDSPYILPLDEPIQSGDRASFTFTVGERTDYQLPRPERGELTLVFSYDGTPLKQATVYLPPGATPSS